MLIQEMWATDSNKVQEFMFSYLKDPLREVEQPYFYQEEVHTPSLLSLTLLSPLIFFNFLCAYFFVFALQWKKCKHVSYAFRCPPCVVVGGRYSDIDMDSHDLGLKHFLPHIEKVIDCGAT